MARVPVVTGPSVEQTALQSPMQRTSATPGLLQDNTTERIGRAMAEIGQTIQERTDADLLMRAETDIKAKYLEWEGEAKQRRGQQAWGVAKEAGSWWDDNASKVGESLTTERQRQLFARTVTQLKGQSVGAFSGFEAGQRRESLDASAQASIVGSINLAAANPQDGALLNATKGDIIKRTAMLAEINGWAPEVREAKQAAYLTNLHKQVLQGLVDRDPSAAEAYFKTNKGEIEGAQHAEIEHVLKAGTVAQRAQTFADEVMASNLDEATALAEARKRFEGEDEKHAVAEVKTRFAERSQARERQQRDAADEAYGIYARTGRIGAIPPSVMSRMDGRTVLSLRLQAQQDADRAAGREVKLPPTDWDRYYELRRQALEDPQAFKRRDLRAEFPHLGKAEREGLIDLQSKADKPVELKEATELATQLSNTHDLLKLSGPGNVEKRGQLDVAVTQAVANEERRLGKRLAFDERQKIIDRMVLQVAGSGGWFSSDKRMFEVLNDPAAVTRYAAKVPAEDRAKITDALKRAGKPATESAILDLYVQRKGLPK